ncbi:MAG: hypothetical protein HKN20_01205, partial [Gemmatimonadetes bacterium]|nr:hypothetical protein [Gemmatimonadota bacterium]
MRPDFIVRLSALALAAATLWPAVADAAPRPVPDIYPKFYTTMIGRLEPSDFAGMRKYDVLEVGNWAFTTGNGFRDSMETLRAENPNLMVMQDWSAAISCDNWWSDETPDREAWGDTLEAHEYDWILHDKNGGKWFINGESEICNQGRINLTNLDAARAYAKYIAKATVHEYPDLIEGIRLDEVAETIHWWHSVPQRWDPGVDSIDSNRDGIGDSNEDLTLWWSAGVDTFLATLRAEFGPEYLIIVNGYLAPEHFQYVNGRWHEGHPHEHKKGYESGMTDPERGYLGGDTLYSDTPAHFSGLFCLNFTPSYNYDPDELSTKYVPFPHPGLHKYVKWTLASSLMSDG